MRSFHRCRILPQSLNSFKHSWLRIQIRIITKVSSFLPSPMCHLSIEFCENRLSVFCVILLTDKQTNKRWWKHNSAQVIVALYSNPESYGSLNPLTTVSRLIWNLAYVIFVNLWHFDIYLQFVSHISVHGRFTMFIFKVLAVFFIVLRVAHTAYNSCCTENTLICLKKS